MQYIYIDVNSSRGNSEEVEKALDVSLIQIINYRFDGEITILLGQTIYYDGGVVT